MAILSGLSVEDAWNRLQETIVPLDVVELPLADALGMTLAEDVVSAVDSPPFDKSAMDGYAVQSSDVATGSALLKVVDVILAGSVPAKPIGSGEAAQIMTGAPIPPGADAVVKVEETKRDADCVSISTRPPDPGANIIRLGNSVRVGDRVMKAGLVLNGSRIGALAELGHATVRVRRRPQVAILTTGNELVPIEQSPAPGQIRNSNASMLVAQIQASGGNAVSLGIARDEVDDLRLRIESGLQSDVLVLSGGVSAGTVDLVPSALAAAGVRQIFHKVEMKPGKPIWFGIYAATSERRACYVFGLPGNPVSSLVCCELFVRTAIRRLMGVESSIPQPIFAKLEHDYSTRKDRPTYHPARLTWTRDGLVATLVPWHGSSDLCGTVDANGMALLTAEARQYHAGELVETFSW